MDKEIIDLWADIGAKDYWTKFLERNNGKGIFVPFECRWPQPGFVGSEYFDVPLGVVVMGQNPNAPKKENLLNDDEVMFDKIREHSNERTSESLEDLFELMPEFMLGGRIVDGKSRPKWTSVRTVEKHLNLCLDEIAYLNLNPLTLTHTRIVSQYREAFELSTKRQLTVLNPDKIIIYGKGAYDKFVDWADNKWKKRACYLLQAQYANSLSPDEKEDYAKRINRMRKWLKF